MDETIETKPEPNDVLYLVASSGNVTVVKELLASKASTSYVNSDGNSALHIAFLNKHEEVVDLILEEILLTLEFDNLQNPMGLSHLHIACTRRNEQVIQGFLDAGADPHGTIDTNSPHWAGFNALHFAASFQSLQAMKVLLKTFMNHNTKTSTGKTALELIYENFGNVLIMVDLLEDRNKQKRRFSNFQMACLNEDEKIVQKFIDHGAAKINSKTSHDLIVCSYSSTLHCAVASNCKEKVELLLQNGAEVECYNRMLMTPLHLALHGDPATYDNRIIKILYAALVDKMANHEDRDGLSFFHAAIESNDMSTVKKYLDEGKADVNKPLSSYAGRFSNCTPLHMAVLFKRLEIAKFLIKCGADVNAVDMQNRTPLYMAFQYGYHNFINLLFMNTTKVECTAVDQKTNLHFLVQLINSCYGLDRNEGLREKFFMYIEQLVKLGIDVNAKDKNGNTALHYLQSTGTHWVHYFQMLLDLGADINLKNNNDKLPFNSIQWPMVHVDNKIKAIFYHHVQQLKALDLNVDPGNDEICRLIAEDGKCFENEELIGRKQQRTEEIAKLKSIKIGDATSLYNFVKLDSKRLTLYDECQILKNIAEDEDLKKKFPSYGYLIQLKYRAAIGFYGSTATKRRHGDVDGGSSDERQCSQ